MSIPEACVEAVKRRGLDDAFEARARRVITALADHLPDSAVEKAREAYRASWAVAQNDAEIDAAMDDAIVSALKDVAGETP